MRPFTLIQKRAYLQGVISDEQTVEPLKSERDASAATKPTRSTERFSSCLLYTSDAADD